MKRHIVALALLAACAAALAGNQRWAGAGHFDMPIVLMTPSGSGIQPRPLPQPLPSTGADTQGTSPRTPETSAGTSGITPDNAARSSSTGMSSGSTR